MRSDDDVHLVELALSGDASAFETLAERHYPRTYRICFGVLGNPHDAEDCVQDTWIKIFRSLSSFGGRASFSTWLYRIAMNTCYDHLRRHRAHMTWSLDSEPPDGQPGIAHALASEDPLPDERLLIDASAAEIRAHILRLTPKHARVLWLRDIEGLGYAQIAAIEQISEGTVKSRLFRARAQLGRALIDKELF